MDPIGHLHAGDGDALVRLIADAYHDDPGPDLPWALLDGLRDLLGRDTLVTYTCYAPSRCAATASRSSPTRASTGTRPSRRSTSRTDGSAVVDRPPVQLPAAHR